MKKSIIWKLLLGMLTMIAMTVSTGCTDDNDDIGAPSLKVAPTTLAFGADGQATDQFGGIFVVETNRPWRAKVEENQPWVRLSATEGTGNATVTVTVPAFNGGRSASVTFEVYNSYGVLLSQTVTVTQGEVKPPVVIYGNNFDKTLVTKDADGRWPFLDQNDGWQNAKGTGIESVTYAYNNASVRSSAKNSGGYDGASGQNKIFFGTAPANFDIDKITLPSGETNYRITFGAAYSKNTDGVYDNTFKPEFFHVWVGNGTVWEELTYEKIGGSDAADPFWIQFKSDFTLKTALSELSIRFTTTTGGEAANSAFSIDDLQFMNGPGGQEVSFGGSPTTPTITAVNPTSLAFAAEGGTKTVAVTVANQGENALSVSGLSGLLSATVSGTTVTVVAQANTGSTDNQTLTITLANGNSKTVPVTLAGPGDPLPGDVIYNETVGTASVAKPYPEVADYTGWVTTGSGAANVSYLGSGKATSVRTPTIPNTGAYEGASGGNSVFFGTPLPAIFTVQNIELTSAQTNLQLTFGGNSFVYDTKDNSFNKDNFVVSLSADGTTFVPLTYAVNTSDPATPFWVFATADFTLSAPSTKLYIKFEAKVASIFRLDDITLKTGSGGQSIDLGGGVIPTTPTITAVNPTSLSFTNAGGTQTVAVTVENQGSNALSVSGLSGLLGATVSGNTVTVTAQANTGTAENQTLTIALAGGNSKTVPVVLAGVGGGGTGTTVTFGLAEIKASDPSLLENGYGTQVVATPSTWVNWTVDGIAFTGVKICQSAADKGGVIQMQGNATEATKQAKLQNVTPMSNIQSIRISHRVYPTKDGVYFAPTYTMTVGGATQTPTETITEETGYKVYVHEFNLASLNAGTFNLDNNTVGALYIESFEVTYKN